MKLAITDWNGRVSPLFDTADTVIVFKIENNREQNRSRVYLNPAGPVAKAKALSRLAVNVVVCGAISREFETMLTAAGITVVGNICGLTENVLQAHLNKKLNNRVFRLPGSNCPRRKRSGHGHQNQP